MQHPFPRNRLKYFTFVKRYECDEYENKLFLWGKRLNRSGIPTTEDNFAHQLEKKKKNYFCR